jgi:type I restriction enzyme S subunit
MKTEVVKISQVATQVRGVSYDKEASSREPREGFLPILRANNITDEGLAFSDFVYVPKSFVSQRQKLLTGDIVVAASSGSLDVVGKAAPLRCAFEGSFGAFCKVVRPNERVFPSYLANFFKTSTYRRIISSLAAGANINNLRSEHIDNLQIPLPPLAEQRRIAEVLDKAEALRSKRRAALAELHSLTQSLFLDLFGDPAINLKGWRMSSLSEISAIHTGKTPPTQLAGMFGGETPFATPGDLDEGLLSTERTLTADGVKYSKVVRAGSALVCCIGNIGKMAKTPVSTAFNQQINAVEWGIEIHDDFGIAALAFQKQQMLNKASSTIVPILNKSGFSKVTIPVPPIDLQREFARRVTVLEKLKAKQKASLADLDTLFFSLQQRAFSGNL